MKYLFEAVSTRLGDARGARKEPTARRAYLCRCGRPVFFRNSYCLGCNTPLGYESGQARIFPLDAGEPSGTWRLFGADDETLYRRCANYELAAGCNWLVAADAEGATPQPLCRACRLNRTIPDLSLEENKVWWNRIEVAKRRLVSSLIALGLPVRSRVSEDPQAGLAFDLLRAAPGGPKVLTGHEDGIITVDIEEADDARRESTRQAMREPYRTLLGHLRHEVGHYYWQRLVDGTAWHAPFRKLFGDERIDYGAALQRHYQEGPDGGWPLTHVSAYASSHPWEDWAETWAHYLHMVDTLDTALSFGLDPDNVEVHYEPFTPDDLFRAQGEDEAAFLSFVNAWIELTGVLNELSRSMGQPDFYPFVLPRTAVKKLHFVHLVAAEASCGAALIAAPPEHLPGTAADRTGEPAPECVRRRA